MLMIDDELDPTDELLIDSLRRAEEAGELSAVVHSSPNDDATGTPPQSVTAFDVPASALEIPGMPAAAPEQETSSPLLVVPGDASAPPS